MNLPLKGIIPPLITPLKNYDRLDRPGLERLLEHLLGHGVHGIFLLGSNGEGPSLSYAIRKEFITYACRIIAGRVPVLVGISDTSLEGSLEIARTAMECGADAVVAAPPYYFPLDQEQLTGYYQQLAEKLPLPFFIYNMPGFTKIQMTVETVRKIRDAGALGIKDSSGDLFFFYSLIETFRDDPDFALITGTEMFLPDAVLHGGHGAVPGGANVFPGLFVRLYEASLSKDLGKIEKLRKQVMDIYNTLYALSPHPSGIPIAINTALSVMGICDDYMAPPLQRMSPAEREQITAFLKKTDNLSQLLLDHNS
jgi:4-hydroxy-tetrahydrodipicolinate synthase